MNVTTTVRPPEGVEQRLGTAQGTWLWGMTFGTIAIVLASIGLLRPVLPVAFSALYYGAILLVAAVFELVIAFKHTAWRDTQSNLIMCVMHALAGIVIVGNPVLDVPAATFLIGSLFLVMGTMRLIGSYWQRGTDTWGWSYFGGWLTAILGFMVLAGWPVSEPFVIGTFVSIEVMIYGWTTTASSLAAKHSPLY